jgi:transcription antitermination protein NusB
MGLRREARITALKSLYLVDVCGLEPGESIDSVFDGKKSHPDVDSFVKILVSGCLENIKEIDRLISENAENWSIDRMTSVDRNILRIGIFEILKMDDIPINVIINEAIEIAKDYSSDASSKFVNGILDKIQKERPAGQSGKKIEKNRQDKG